MGDNIDIEDITDESILAKLVRKHGKDSKVPLLMAIDAIGAGIDTTGNQASFLLYHLAKHPEVQEKLYDEVQACIAKDGSLTADSLMKMRYLKACQQESQRLLPVTSGVTRETQVEMVLGGFPIQISLYLSVGFEVIQISILPMLFHIFLLAMDQGHALDKGLPNWSCMC